MLRLHPDENHLARNKARVLTTFRTAKRSSHHQRSILRKLAGFTLLEVILAIAVTGFILAAATAFVVSLSRIWVDQSDRNFFEDHVDGVTEFLRSSFASAGMEIALEPADQSNEENTSPQESPEINTDTVQLSPTVEGPQQSTEAISELENGGLIRASEEPVAWGKPPGFAEYKDPLLNFKLTSSPPLFISPAKAPSIGIDAFIYFEADEGLSILWYSLLQEDSEDIDDLQRTEISPLVTSIKYIYWDDSFEKWEEEDEPQDGEGDEEFLLPRFIKLTFEYEGETKERTLAIPVPSTSALIF